MRSRNKQLKEVDYGFATEKARQFIRDYGIDWLPVDPFEIAEKMGLEVKTIERLSEETGIDRFRLIKSVIDSEDGLAIYDPDTNEYKIVINEQVEPYGRIRWTMMHEIGHIVLGHLNDFRQTSITRRNLNDEEYDALEQEAHIFAGEVLAPKYILYRIGAHSPTEIEEICELSKAAARSRSEAVTELIYNRDKMHDSMLTIIPSFERFLEFVTVCCQRDELKVQSKIKKPRPKSLPAAAIEDVKKLPNGKYSKCPRCGNREISEDANFCMICGASIYHTSPSAIPAAPCGRVGLKEARFCENCGAEVYQTRIGLLYEKDEV